MTDLQCGDDLPQNAQNDHLAEPAQIVAAGHTFEEVYAAQETLKSRRAVIARANEINESRDLRSKTRVGVYQQISAAIPTNDLGLPTFIYRPDIIPPDLDDYTAEQRTAILQAASVPIVYDEGLPTLEDGTSFWTKFPWEPFDSYEMFQRFVDMPTLEAEVSSPTTSKRDNSASNSANIQIAVRDLRVLAELYPASTGTRSSALTPAEYLEKLREYAILYCWNVRVKAYDLYIAAAYRKWREQKTYAVEQSHYRMSEQLLAKANAELLNRFNDPDEIKEIKAKDLLDVFKSMVQIQRVSLGMSATGDRSGEDGAPPKNASLELTLRTIAKSAGEEAKALQNDDSIQSILNDPDALVKAQELIIRMNRR